MPERFAFNITFLALRAREKQKQEKKGRKKRRTLFRSTQIVDILCFSYLSRDGPDSLPRLMTRVFYDTDAVDADARTRADWISLYIFLRQFFTELRCPSSSDCS